MSRADGGGLLSRWSRRKLESRKAGEEPPPEAAAADTDPELGPDAALAADRGALPDEPQAGEGSVRSEALPDPATMQPGDDFSVFMREGVPDALRRQALRTLWRSNPALANLDGLIDYGEDFTDAALVPEVVNTAYKVGQGFLKRVLDEGGEEGEAAAASVAEAAPTSTPAPAARPATGHGAATATQEPSHADGQEQMHRVGQAEAPPAPRPRRMTFST